ncbi:MAG: sulfur carrier protein ThiS [Acutalibacteraceae bacterium]|nr:sulfur carrier protein ThiS [Acutalibacteraceae bacterium]
MKIIVAGEAKEVKDGLTIAQLLIDEQVETPEYVTVTVNDDFIDSSKFEITNLQENDTVEFLYYMGGGRYVVY